MERDLPVSNGGINARPGYRDPLLRLLSLLHKLAEIRNLFKRVCIHRERCAECRACVISLRKHCDTLASSSNIACLYTIGHMKRDVRSITEIKSKRPKRNTQLPMIKTHKSAYARTSAGDAGIDALGAAVDSG